MFRHAARTTPVRPTRRRHAPARLGPAAEALALGLALAVTGSFVTNWIGTAAFGAHVVCGCVALVIVLFRGVWGWVGPAHARFADFVRGPRAVLASLQSLRLAGHTPLGGWMAVALLAGVGVQAGLGLFANDQILHTGPLYGYVSARLSNRLSSWHDVLANLIPGAVALHLAAALYYRYPLGDDRVGPLVSGYKRGVAAQDAIGSQRLWLALVIVAALAAPLVWVLQIAPDASLEL